MAENDVFAIGDKVTPKKEPLKLINKIPGITRLSSKLVLGLFVVAGLLIALLMFALDGMDDKGASASSKKKKEETQSGAVAAAVVPKTVSERPDGVLAMASMPNFPEKVGNGPSQLTMSNGNPVIGKSNVPALPGDNGKDVVVQKNGTTVVVPRLNNDGSVRSSNNDGTGKIPTQEDHLKEAAVQKRYSIREQAVDSGGAVKGFTDDGAQSPLGDNGRTMVPPATSSQPTSGQMLAAANNGQDDPNKQARKERFLEAAATARDDGYLNSLQKEQISKYELKAGAIIPCVLQAGVNSDLPGMVRGIVTEDVHDSRSVRHLLIPKGTQAVGTYDSQVAFGQKRLLVVWSKLIFPNGSTMMLMGMPAADQSGAAGMTGDVNNHWMSIFGAALATSIISAGVQASQHQVVNTVNGAAQQPTMSQTMAASLGQQLGQLGMAISQKNMNVQPTIETKIGTRFYINVTKDMVFLKPY